MTDSSYPALQRTAATPPNSLSWQRRLLQTVSIALLVAVVAGVTYPLHASWHALPEILRISILIGSSAGTFAVTMWLRHRGYAGHHTIPAAAVALYCFVADIAGLIQMFNVEPSTVPLLFCTAFAFLLTFSLQSRWLLTTGLIGTAACVAIWVGGDISTYQIYIQTQTSAYSAYIAPELFLPGALLIFFASFIPLLGRFPGFAAFFRTFAFVMSLLILVIFTSNVQEGFNYAFEGGRSYFHTYFGVPVAIFADGHIFGYILLSALAIWLILRRSWANMITAVGIIIAYVLFEVTSKGMQHFSLPFFAGCLAATTAAIIYLRKMRWKSALAMTLLVMFLFLTMKLPNSIRSAVGDWALLLAATLLFFLLVIPFRRLRSKSSGAAWPSPRHVVMAGVTIIVIANAYVASTVILNRIGEPDSILALTERELFIPEPNTVNHALQTPLSLHWRNPVTAHYIDERASRSWTTAWLNDAKLTELGFAAQNPVPQQAAFVEFHHPIAKEVLLVLEFEGPAWHEALESAAEFDAYRATHGKTEQEIIEERVFYPSLDKPLSQLDMEQHLSSRLFVVDAGLDQTKLRAKYPDRKHYSIVRGMVELHEFKSIYDPTAGRILGLGLGSNSIEQIANIDKSCRPGGVHPLREHYNFFGFGSSVAPCTVTIAFGKHLEPWIVDAKPE